MCHEEYQDSGDDVNVMLVTSCGHVYHKNCLQEWLAKSTSCPMCRENITSECTPYTSLKEKMDASIDQSEDMQIDLQNGHAEKDNLLPV